MEAVLNGKKRSFALGISVGPRHTPEMIKGFIAGGYTHFELSYPCETAHRGNEEGYLAAAKPLLDAMEQEGIVPWSWHIPFGPEWDIAARDEEERKRVVSSIRRLTDLIAPTGIRVLTIHGCLEPVKDEERTVRMLQAAKSLRELQLYADGYGLTVALENLPRSCLANDPEETLRLAEASGCRGICFDVNHLLKSTHSDFLDACAGRIVTTHLSDYDGIDERHRLPGEGVVPFGLVFARLLESGYRGPMLFELRNDPAANRPYGADEVTEALKTALKK